MYHSIPCCRLVLAGHGIGDMDRAVHGTLGARSLEGVVIVPSLSPTLFIWWSRRRAQRHSFQTRLGLI